MANGIPVRLSADLAQRARSAAETADRSVTDQVEHWARLGQAVEDAVLAKTVERLKARSHDADLDERLAFAATPDGRAKALELIQSRAATANNNASASTTASGSASTTMKAARRAPTAKRARHTSSAAKKRAR
jgi:hypothetical protein